MAEYTYFIITPGYDRGSYVDYPDGPAGNYIKFGDQASTKPSPSGLRSAYLTHNPDIGVMAIMDSSAITGPYLGTELKRFIVEECNIEPIGSTEWFSVERQAAWELANRMRDEWDDRTVDHNNLNNLKELIRWCLT